MPFDIRRRFLRQAQDEQDCISPRTAFVIYPAELSDGSSRFQW
jgi:hypothetical protein